LKGKADMRTSLCVLLVFAIPMTLVLADPPTDAKSLEALQAAAKAAEAARVAETKAMAGTWEHESIKLDGNPLTAEQAKSFGPGIIIGLGTIGSSDPNSRDVKNLYKIDPSKSPKWITMDKTLVGMNKDSNGRDVKRVIVQKQVGIYQLDGDKLTICWSTKNRPPRFDQTGRVVDSGTSKERPETFDGEVGTILFFFKRTSK
jgi:uncharacterized protein (TIGR03067 family)